MRRLLLPGFLAVAALTASACNKVPVPAVLPVSKVSRANYDQVRPGMSKTQVEAILGQPTSVDTKDLVIYKRTVYRYEDGGKFIQVTFKNDELDGKDTNLGV